MNNQQNMPPEAVIMQMIIGMRVSRCVSLVAELGLTDLLAEGSRTVSYLAEQTGSNEDALNRVLAFLAQQGVYSEVAAGQYENNLVSDVLGNNHPDSIRSYVQFLGSNFYWNIVYNLDHAVKTGEPAILRGSDKTTVFDVLQEHPKEQILFQEAMTKRSKASGKAIADAYDWAAYDTIVDVGGGQGMLASLIAQRAPSSSVIYFDLPHVIDAANNLLEQNHLPNLQAVGGDFFECVPGPADLIVMKYIIHDWDDKKSAQILTNCKEQLKNGGRILLCEGLMVTDGSKSVAMRSSDINMLLVGGKERTQQNFADLAAQVGLKLCRIIDTEGGTYLVELM
ncbi:MAG: methyltransferase domain-containing protein [Anaerolineae bacterium]|jgi:hypothetical protein|nr:methyltransferase domain-containing protein [Anaerolineae bacterium]MBT7072460.1 methyltransferase domain-containing protein [Anaerolineae bacterium]MBT7989336.1 methyltransferase domain-containing protein [Anaerolineae bacterium]